MSADTPARQKDLLEHSAADIHFWINTFVWQFNPNTIGEGSLRVGPFITWDFQDEAISTILRCIDPKTRHDLLIVKSREVGASWLCLLAMDWLYLFRQMQKFLVISRNEWAVDKPGEPDSLFWKVDFIHDHLPGWMTEGRVKRRKMGFANPKLRSFVTGQASTGKAGVGGRADAMFIDEFSQIEEDYEVYHRTSDTTGCRIFNGTHCGTGTCFHELSESKVSSIEKLQMHWSQHPDKRKGLYRWDEKTNTTETLDPDYEYGEGFNPIRSVAPAGGPFPGLRSPWYDRQVERKGSSRAVAMDLDIDAGGSQSQYFEPIMIQRLISEYCMEPTWQGDISYDRETGRPLALVPGPGGPLKLWLTLRYDGLPPEDIYFLGGDIATGTGATPSCFSGLNLTGLKVLEYTNPFIDSKSLAFVAAALGWMFKSYTGEGGQWVWEHCGPGISFGGKLMDLGYTNIRMQTPDLSYAQFGKISDKPGWTPNPTSIQVLLEDYRSALSTRLFINRSELALMETKHFRYAEKGRGIENAEWESKNDPSGARVNHGDHVIADALAWKLAKPYVERRAVKKETKSTGNGVCLAWRRELRENKRREEEEW